MTADPSPAVVPQYAQIAADLRDKIRDGTYGPGAYLPSRNEITAIYGVSAITARDALAVISREGYATAVRGRGHIVRRKRSRLSLPSRIYGTLSDPEVPLELREVEVFREPPPGNITLALQADGTPVWVRRAVYIAVADRQAIQIHISWLPGLTDTAGNTLRDADPAAPWPETIRYVTGRTVTSVLQHTRARRADPREAETFHLPATATVFVAHATTYDPRRHPIEHSRYTWPSDAVHISDYYTHAPTASP